MSKNKILTGIILIFALFELGSTIVSLVELFTKFSTESELLGILELVFYPVYHLTLVLFLGLMIYRFQPNLIKRKE